LWRITPTLHRIAIGIIQRDEHALGESAVCMHCCKTVIARSKIFAVRYFRWTFINAGAVAS